MEDLADKNVYLAGGIPAFDIKEIHKYLKKIDGWDVLKDKEKNYYIEKNFKFSNYVESEKFVLKRRENCRNRGPSSGHLFWLGIRQN